MAAASAEYVILTTALEHGLRTGQSIRPLIEVPDEHLDQAQQHDSRRQVLDSAIAAYPQPVSKQQLGELSQLHDRAGSTALAQHRIDDADAHYRAELALVQAAGDRSNEGVTYHQLGIVAGRQRPFAEAEASYRQAPRH
jgi:hypothetical protein